MGRNMKICVADVVIDRCVTQDTLKKFPCGFILYQYLIEVHRTDVAKRTECFCNIV